MQWAQSIVKVLKDYEVKFINFVPDAMGEQIMRVAREDPFFELLPLAREEEGIGVASGQAVAGGRGAVLFPGSGLGNSINALASLAIPYRIPVPMIIGHRGNLGEFNATQVMMGQSLTDILDSLRIPWFEMKHQDEVETLVEGMLRVCYASESPAACLISTQLAGWKE